MIATFLLSAAIQGFLIALALILKKAKNRPSNIYLSLLIVFFSLELLFSWGGISGYNNSKYRIPFWLLNSYLTIPPAVWLFLRHNSEANFKFSTKHLWFFFPALVEIMVHTTAFSAKANTCILENQAFGSSLLIGSLYC